MGTSHRPGHAGGTLAAQVATERWAAPAPAKPSPAKELREVRRNPGSKGAGQRLRRGASENTHEMQPQDIPAPRRQRAGRGDAQALPASQLREIAGRGGVRAGARTQASAHETALTQCRRSDRAPRLAIIARSALSAGRHPSCLFVTRRHLPRAERNVWSPGTPMRAPAALPQTRFAAASQSPVSLSDVQPFPAFAHSPTSYAV